MATIRDRIQKACAGGAADALGRLDLNDLGMRAAAGSLFARGMPGMCKELAQ
jgi:hypothetical protein